jgi:hypothetical protein
MVQKPEDFIPSKSSTADIWISWYKALKDELGEDDANVLFKSVWDVRGSDDANTPELRDFLAKYGITVKMGAKEAILDAITSPFDFFNFAKDIGKTMIYGWIIFIFLIMAVVIYFLFRASKNPGETIGVATKVAMV